MYRSVGVSSLKTEVSYNIFDEISSVVKYSVRFCIFSSYEFVKTKAASSTESTAINDY